MRPHMKPNPVTNESTDTRSSHLASTRFKFTMVKFRARVHCVLYNVDSSTNEQPRREEGIPVSVWNDL